MNGEKALQLWSAAAGRWAQWIKPSLFTQMPEIPDEQPEGWPDAGFLPDAGDTALVLDLAGAASIPLAGSLSRRGYCPVPMYNTTFGTDELIDTGYISRALMAFGPQLQLNASGPPAFMLDHIRNKYVKWKYGDYDNRWIIFDSDFPTAARFQELGVKKLLIVTPDLGQDLHDALAKHLVLRPSLIHTQTKQASPFPPPRFALWRGLERFARTFAHAPGAPFGHRMIQSPGG